MEMKNLRYFLNSKKDIKDVLGTYKEVSKTDTINNTQDY